MMSKWAFGSELLGVFKRSVRPSLLSSVGASDPERTHYGLENLKEVFVIVFVVSAIFSFVFFLVATSLFLFSISCHLFVELLFLFFIHLFFIKFILLLGDNELEQFPDIIHD